MSVTRVSKTSGSSTSDSASGPASASVSFVDGDVAIYAAHWSRSGGSAAQIATPVFTPSVGSLTLSLLGLSGTDADQPYFTGNGRRVAVWGGIVSGSVTGTFQQVLANTHDGFMYGIEALQGVDVSGGIGAVLRQAPAKASSAGATSISLSLGAAPDATDYVMAFFGVSAGGSVVHTPDTDFTQLRNVTAINTPSLRFWIDASTGGGGNVTCGGSLDSSSSFAALALAFKAAGGGSGGRAGVNRGIGRQLINGGVAA